MMETPEGRLVINTDGRLGQVTKVELDGVDISSLLTGVDVSFSVGAVNKAVLHMLPSEIQIQADVAVEYPTESEVSAIPVATMGQSRRVIELKDEF